MIKGFIKFILKAIFSFFIFVLLLVLFAALTMGPDVKDDSVLVLDLWGQLLEQGPRDWKERLLMGDVLTTRAVLDSLEKAKTDDRIRGVLVKSMYSYLGPAKAQELRSAIQDFAKTKKPVFSYLEDGGTIDYYICSSSPVLFMPPEADSWFTLLGIRVEHPFLQGTLDKLGVEAQMDHIGQYKGGSEMYTRQDMSEPNRRQTEELLDSLYDKITTDIAADRKLKPEKVRDLIDRGPLISPELKKNGLVDDLIYYDEVLDRIQKKLNLDEVHTISVRDYQHPTFFEALDEKPDKIAIVYATGTIMPGRSENSFGEDVMGSDTISRAFRDIRKDSSIKAVVFRIDSPGGSPSASDLIWREVQLTTKDKPVIVSMADVAASGGYYISMPASQIYADPSTITGSIGVYGGKFYLKGLYDKIGLKKEIVKRGEHADLFSDYVPFDEEEWTIVRKHMQHTYDAFTRKAAEARKKTQQEIDEIAQGRVWSGQQAIQKGLVDQLGGLKEAVAAAKKLAKLDEVSFVEYPSSEGGFGEMLSESKTELMLPADLRRWLIFARLAKIERVLLWMPYRIYLQ